MSNEKMDEVVATKSDRLLWLTHERLPHPDAVICPAEEHQVRLVIGLLNESYERRMGIVQRLQAIVSKFKTLAPVDRPSIPARMPNGLYQPISWRFALWLRHAMALKADDRRQDLIRTLEQWSEQGADCDRVSLTEFMKV
jgi:hypothetical protein